MGFLTISQLLRALTPITLRHSWFGIRKSLVSTISIPLTTYNSYAKKQAKEQDKIPEPRDLITLKHFVKFYVRAMHCKKIRDNPNGLPKPNTVRNRIREFTSAYNRRNRHERPIPEEVRHSITNVSFADDLWLYMYGSRSFEQN